MIILICLNLLFRIPSLFEPYWYGDEGIYLTIGNALRNGVELYSGIHDNKPPLLYVVAALANGQQFWYRLIAAFWSCLAVILFFKISKNIFSKNYKVFITSLIFVFLINWPKLEGNIANAELFFLVPTLSAFYILWKDYNQRKMVFIAGVLFGLGGLFKMPALAEIIIWPLWWLKSADKKWFSKSLWLGIGALSVILGSLLYFGIKGNVSQYITAAWAQNIPYLSSWKVTSQETGIFSLKGRILALGFAIGLLWIFVRKEEKSTFVIFTWALVNLFAGLLSGRPYPHYLLQSIGSLALVAAFLVFRKDTKQFVLSLVTLCCYLYSLIIFSFYGYRDIEYYRNFLDWVIGKKNQMEYFAWFDPKVNLNYKISQIIASGSKPDDKIFVWGDEPMIYAISKRLPESKYTVKYHIKDFKAELSTMTQLQNKPPKFIVSFGNEDELPGLQKNLESYYIVQETINGATIYRRIAGGI